MVMLAHDDPEVATGSFIWDGTMTLIMKDKIKWRQITAQWVYSKSAN